MVIIIEMDKQWTVGIDNFKYLKGVRLGFIAIHIMFRTFDQLTEAIKKDTAE